MVITINGIIYDKISLFVFGIHGGFIRYGKTITKNGKTFEIEDELHFENSELQNVKLIGGYDPN